jgi:ABC-type thiamine transport system substrate-binding protein
MLTSSLRSAAYTGIVALGILGLAAPALADGELNLYSSRHYDTDERLYSDFEEATGITINRIEASADELIQRMASEGANSPADILMTVDAGRLYRADQLGFSSPMRQTRSTCAFHPICATPMATGTDFRSARGSSSMPRTGSKIRH